jgi:4-amino-4-deoxy-L-arabinose transferase-like glycosyltransferase
MLGKLLNYLTSDVNTSFILISIIASGLTVAALFILANRMYEGTIAIWSAILAMTSPLLWFYGEVALSYIVEAFFSVFFAYLCWRILNGEHKLIFISALVLALAGGIRQSTMVFLIPLWLYSIRNVRYTYILISFALFIAGVMSWFLPMISITGGYAQYKAATYEHWSETFEPFTVINVGLKKSLIPYILKFIWFVVSGLGLFTAIAIFCIFKSGLKKIRRELFSKSGIFIALWIMPYVFALILFFMQTANPAYSLIFMPALFIVSVKVVKSFSEHVYSSINIFVVLIIFTIIFNAYIFIFSNSPLSKRKLEENHAYVRNFVSTIRTNFSPTDTIILSPKDIFSPNYLLASPRHFMYYLPEYRVYLIEKIVDEGTDIRVGFRKFYWQNHKTFVSDTMSIPREVKYFVSPLWNERVVEELRKYSETIDILYEDNKSIAFHGDINLILKTY